MGEVAPSETIVAPRAKILGRGELFILIDFDFHSSSISDDGQAAHLAEDAATQ